MPPDEPGTYSDPTGALGPPGAEYVENPLGTSCNCTGPEGEQGWGSDEVGGLMPKRKSKYPQYDSKVTVEKRKTIVNMLKSVGRNQPCPCGSGKKFKQCCIREERAVRTVEKKRVIVLDKDVAKALNKARKAGKTIKMKTNVPQT